MMTDETMTPEGEDQTPKPTESHEASQTTEMAQPSPNNDDGQQEAEASDTPVPAPEAAQALPEETPEAPAEAEVVAGSSEPETPPFVAAEEPAAPIAENEPTLESEPAQEAPTQPEPEPVPGPEPEREPVRAAVEAPTHQDDAALFEAALDALDTEETAVEGAYKKLSRGDRVEATVIQVDHDRVFVDLGTKSEGVVPLAELGDQHIESAKDHFKIGDKIQVVVLRPEGAEGNPVVSKKRADFEDAWDRIETAYREQHSLTAPVVERVKGGLVVDIGVRGFVPATHVGSGKLRNIEKYVGEVLQLKIIEIDRDRKKVVLSNRQAEEERRARAKEEIFEKVQPGDVLEGTVRRLTDYGAFVDLGGVDGLLHISEMSWMRINHPKEMFKEGQDIKVMVLRLDANTGKISLGHRQVLPDPWNLIRENYSVNQRFTTKISRLVVSGAFVKLPEGAEAFLPVSEMSNRRVRKPDEVVEEGQDVEVQIIDLRPDERRMVLSMRAVGGGADTTRPGGGMGAPSYGDDDDRGKRGKKGKKGKGGRRGGMEDEMEDMVGRRGYATGGATIGERLGMLKGLFRSEDEEIEEEEEVSGEESSTEEPPVEVQEEEKSEE